MFSSTRSSLNPGSVILKFGIPLAVAALLALIFRDGIGLMVRWWSQPEYQHGYAIPFISLYLLWIKSDRLQALGPRESWLGVALVLAGLAVGLAGEISAIYTIIQYGFLLTLYGVVLAAVGLRGSLVLWAGLAYLVFMIPLPRFIQFPLTSELQLVSSQLGAAMLRWLGVSVYLEGNIIDLGLAKLQVVEACSGLRYLFPLMSLGFLFAYLYRGPVWHKIVVFVSTIPITIFMNSFRIAMMGILMNEFSLDIGEGFLHFFEGWVIFMACIAILLFELAMFARWRGAGADDAFVVELPPLSDLVYLFVPRRLEAPMIAVVVLLAVGAFAMSAIGNREELVPERASLASFPLVISGWTGTEGVLSEEELQELKLSDYLLMNYRRPGEPAPIELYVAWYDSQRKGASVHSPRACIPGGGWRIESLEQVEIPGALPDGLALPVNRTLIGKGQQKLLVYYWFEQRGRHLTNEYLVKWFVFWDSVTRHRTDGALVRVMTPVVDPAMVDRADQRLVEFIQAVAPRLDYFLPGQEVVTRPASDASGPDIIR